MLRFALSISPDVFVVQVLAEELDTEDLAGRWGERVEAPIRAALNRSAPRLVVIRSPYRLFFQRLLVWLRDLTAQQPDRQIVVLIPELVQRRWYQFIVSHRPAPRGGTAAERWSARLGGVHAVVPQSAAAAVAVKVVGTRLRTRPRRPVNRYS